MTSAIDSCIAYAYMGQAHRCFLTERNVVKVNTFETS